LGVRLHPSHDVCIFMYQQTNVPSRSPIDDGLQRSSKRWAKMSAETFNLAQIFVFNLKRIKKRGKILLWMPSVCSRPLTIYTSEFLCLWVTGHHVRVYKLHPKRAAMLSPWRRQHRPATPPRAATSPPPKINMSRVVAFADAQECCCRRRPLPLLLRVHSSFTKTFSLRRSFFPFSHTAQQQNDTRL
jgi:hypothetical protein